MTFTDRLFGKFSGNSRWWLLGVLIAALILRLLVAWQPVSVLVTKNLPDDSFYYFTLARNIISSGSVSTDGINATNGFHPLWLLLLLPVFGWTLPGAEFPIHLALTLGGFIDLISIWLIARLALELSKRWEMGILAAWFYAINPIVILQTTNGLETSIGALTVVLFLGTFKNWLEYKNEVRTSLNLGLAGGVMLLARSDSLFILVSAMGFSWWFSRSARGGTQRELLVAFVALAVVAPWLIWSQLAVGTFVQESGLAVPYAIRERLMLEKGPSLAYVLGESLHQLSSQALWLRGDFSGLPFFTGFTLWGVLVVGLLRRWKGLTRIVQIIFLSLLSGSLALIVFHAGLRLYARPWYFIPSSIAFVLCLALVGKQYLDGGLRLFVTSAAGTAYFLLSGFIFWSAGLYPWQSGMFTAKEWLNDNIPTDATIASLNSGIYSYYHSGTVINLDGVINHNAYQAVRKKRLFSYMQQSGVDFLLDSDFAVWSEYAPFMGGGFPDLLKEYAVISDDLGYGLGAIRIYRVVSNIK